MSVTDPKIADVQVLGPRRILLMGKAPGATDLILWSEQEEYRQARVDVSVNVGQLREQLLIALPGSQIDVAQSRDVVVVRGMLARADQTAQLRALLQASGYKFVDLTSLAGVQQVQLKVRLAEVQRTAIRSLGANFFVGGSDFFGGSVVGPDGGGAIQPINIGAPEGAPVTGRIPFAFNTETNVSPAVTVFGGFPSVPLEFFLQALAENSYMRILAEPNLVAISGEEASFLAGGEIPIPVVQNAQGAASITIEWKEFGVRLRFRPMVMGDNSIRLRVCPEVSELSDVGAVIIQGFRIPSILSRRADTTLELKSGQTFGMAGLISRNTFARSSRVPGLGDLPIIGAAFRSVRYNSLETELVVLVTASLVEPMSVADPRSLPLPGVEYVAPDDWEFYGLGRIAGRAPACLSPEERQHLDAMGWSELKGPGAWASYDQPAAQSHSQLTPVCDQQAPTTQP